MVVSKMAWWSWKNSNALQELDGHLACAAPHVSGWGTPAVMSAGSDPRGKKYIATPDVSHFTMLCVNFEGIPEENSHILA